ncbi:MAG: GTP cyclohydrolase II [Myxococcota bacterium]
MLPLEKRAVVDFHPQTDAEASQEPSEAYGLRLTATSPLPTDIGMFQMHVFEGQDGKEPIAMQIGDVKDRDDVLIRVHSECLTGEVMGSLKCDCRDQLRFAMSRIAEEGCGVVLYLRQEGRGIGLSNKVRAYQLQAEGHDTVDANRLLALPDDAREYDDAREMLRELGIRSVRLMTNNPAKVTALSDLGVDVRGQVPVVIPPNSYNIDYLRAKRERMGHRLPDDLAVEG